MGAPRRHQYRRGYDASSIRMASPFTAVLARLWSAAIPCRQRATRRSRVGTLPRADTARTGTLQEQGPGPIFRGLARTGARPDFSRPDYPPSRHAPMFRSAAIRLGLPGRLRPTLLRTGLARAEGRACYRLSARLAGSACRDGCAPPFFRVGFRGSIGVRYRLSALPLRISSANGRRRGTACA